MLVGMPGSWKLPDSGRDAEMRWLALGFCPPPGRGNDCESTSLPLTGGAEYGYPAGALLVLMGTGCIGQVLETEMRRIKGSVAGASFADGTRLLATCAAA